MKNFLDFKLLITPQLVKILYVLLQLVVLFYVWIFASFSSHTGFSIMGVVYGLLIFLIGSICVRVFCELIIILFRINDNLDEIKAIKEGSNSI
ncbi:MAG: DUF4282 domain-containing protein [Bacteroidota bacterium]